MTKSPRPLPRLLLPWLPALLYMALIWAMSSLPNPPSAESLPFKDKGAHFLEYAFLGALFAHALRGTFPKLRLRQLLLAAAATTSFWGLLDEIHQAFVPNRSADPRDLLADVLGAFVGAGLYVLVALRRRQRAI